MTKKSLIAFLFICLFCFAARSQPHIDYPKGFEGYSERRVGIEGYLPSPNAGGAFRTTCEYSHMNSDDPIQFPGYKDKSHLHTFFGNTLTNYSSTFKSLLNEGNSTCAGGILNRSAYWVPSMLDENEKPIAPNTSVFYYKNGPDIGHKQIKLLPDGLKMLVGDPHRTPFDNPIGQESIFWGCRNTWRGHTATIPTDCPIGDFIELSVFFPQCWDGKNLDSYDHKRHMNNLIGVAPYVEDGITYSTKCPTSHPVALPNISFHIFWQVTKANQENIQFWKLSSDRYDPEPKQGGISAHGDWFGAWDPEIKKRFTEHCLNKNTDCHGQLLGDGTSLY